MLLKIQELLPFGKFVTQMLIFRSSRSQMFLKIAFLENFAIFRGKHPCWLLQAICYKTPAVAASEFSRQQILFLAESGVHY